MQNFDELFDAIQSDNPEVAEAWKKVEPGYLAVRMLIRLRKSQGLSQVELAQKAGWQKSYVSRLESGKGGMPATATMIRYAAACDAHLGLVVAKDSDGNTGMVIEDTLALGPDLRHHDMFATLQGRDIDEPHTAVAC